MSQPVHQAPLKAQDWRLLSVWVLFLAALRAASDREVDAFWMVREGLALLQGSPLVHPDVWSWAPVDRHFVPTSPLWQFALAQSWKWAGLHGVFLVSFTSIALALTLIAVLSRAIGAGPELTVGILITVSIVCGPLFVARAALPALTLFALLAFVATRQLDRIRHMPMALALGTSALWLGLTTSLGLWLHMSWSAYGPAAFVVVSVVAIFDRQMPMKKRLAVPAVALAGVMLAIALGPRGFLIFADAARVADACRGLVVEWMHPWSVSAYWLLLWLATGIALLAVAWWQHRRKVPWSDPAQLFVLLGIAAWGCGALATRFAATALFLGLPSLLVAAGRAAQSQANAKWMRDRLTPAYWRPVLWVLLLALAPLLVTQANHAYSSVTDPTLRELPPACRLFAKDDLSSPVLLARPDVRVWIDGRLDYWGRDRMLRADRYLHSKTDVAPDGSTCILVSTADRSGSYARLASTWRRIAAGNQVDVWIPRARKVATPEGLNAGA